MHRITKYHMHHQRWALRRVSCLAGLALLVLAVSGQTGGDYRPVTAAGLPDGVRAEILPRMELLAGVLSQTSWIDDHGPRGRGNTYFQALQSFFAPYRGHEAVKLAQSLTRRGFTYDAPPNFMASLGELPDLTAINGYSDYLRRRAGGEAVLERFRAALVALAREAEFDKFIAAHREDLQTYLDRSVAGFRAGMILDWQRDFFGWSGDEFHLVLAPAMFPGGGYAATISTPDGRDLVYQVIRADALSEDAPLFPAGVELESLALHEWGHAFVNPSLAKYPRLVGRLGSLFRPVRGMMKKQAYGSLETFLNEQVLRAVTAIAARELYGVEAYEAERRHHLERGFYLFDFTVERLEQYQASRDLYPRFDQFVPLLLEDYYENRTELRKEAP